MSQDSAVFTEAWTAHRSYLIDLAFRMLLDIAEAEDVVQDAFSRFASAEPDQIEDPRGWLAVVTSRLCLDRIRSARSRRERAHDFSASEPVGAAMTVAEPDPAEKVTLDDTVRLALMVLMQRLSTAERVVFVMHDVFQIPFEDIAATVGRPVGTCRQLARRARQRVQADAATSSRFDVSPAEHRELTLSFMAACANGDVPGLMQVLKRDASGEVDLGASATSPGVAHGADVVATNLCAYWRSATLVSLPAQPGSATLLAFRRHRLSGIIRLTIPQDQALVAKVHVIADPAQIALARGQLAATA